jgi:two-component system, NtrC family, sensor kinase
MSGTRMTRILIIDDEPDLLRVLARSLKADDHEVATAPDGPNGLSMFEGQRPAIVITDIKMPGMSGIEVLKRIKKQAPDAEVIIITGHGDMDTAVEALHFGASDFVTKPFRSETLAIAIRRAEEKIDIKRRLREYTLNLEGKVAEATAELRRRSNFLSNLIRSSNDGIVATDENLTVVIFNPEAERILGYRQEDVVQHRLLSELLPGELAEFFRQAMQDAGARRECPWTEATVTALGGESIPVRLSGSVLMEKGRKRGAVVFFQDLREIRHLQRELVHSERLAAIGQTVAGLAHGIKNILHGLKGGSYLVDIGINRKDEQKLRKGWDMIKRSIERTSNLVMDLLSYSKEREPEYDPCDPNAIAGEVCDLMKERAQQGGIDLVRDFDPAIGRVCMDPQTIHTTLLNLVSNALDACLFDEGPPKPWRVIVKTVSEADRTIRFEVVDNGAGMTDEVKAKLFTSFFSTKGQRGTGLGLLVTRKLVQEHGGRIEVQSRIGEGTTVVMRLPYREGCP